MKKTERSLKAIMFSDFKSFSAFMGEDEGRAIRLIKEHREIVRSIIPRHNGEEHETAGDSFLMLFSSAVNAVQCAVEIQETFHRRNQDKPTEEQIWIRIGIHIGDIVIDRGDNHVYGEGVNIAARTEPQAEPGGICITQDVFKQVHRKINLRAICIGKQEMKNIVDAPELYRVIIGQVSGDPESTGLFEKGKKVQPAAEPAPRPEAPSEKGTRPIVYANFSRRFLALMIDVIVFTFIISILTRPMDWLHASQPSKAPVEDLERSPDENKDSDGSQGTEEIKVGLNGINVQSEDGTQVKIGKDGIYVKGEDGEEVTISLSGISIENEELVEIGESIEKLQETVKKKKKMTRAERIYESFADTLKPILWVLYCTLFTMKWGATLGKRALGLKVVQELAPSETPEFWPTLLRQVFFFVSLVCVFLGFLWSIRDEKHRTWHDRVAKTIVIKEN